MILPDVNVLLNAFRPLAPEYATCCAWLDSVVNGNEPFGISPQVLASVVRIASNPRVTTKPDPTEEVLEFCRALIEHPRCQMVQPGPRHWRIFTDLCLKTGARGNLVQDAWFAALAIESGCEWITLDRNYRLFPGLRHRRPWNG